MAKRVMVLGAGASGLTAIKVCLEAGLEVVCYERQGEIGGLWNYKPAETEEASVMKSTVINTSKEMMAFSDFPPPKDAPNFMHNTAVMEYFRSYASHFRLLPHIHFRHSVSEVRRAPDFAAKEQWLVRVADEEGTEREELFDGVLLCTGHHAATYQPSFKGQESFTGRILHSHSYKDYRGFEDKRVVVVGVGNSGGDIAVELSRIAAQVYSVTRRGTWVFNRVGNFGVPLDIQISRRHLFGIRNVVPWLFDRLSQAMLNARFDHANFGLKPAHGVFCAHPTINDDLPNRILCGSIVIKPNIERLAGSSVYFEDGTVVEDVDALIVATGYSFGFPYLEEGLIPVQENRVSLYHYMYPPELHSPSLAVIGCIQPLGAIMPISEMQARVFAEMLTGRANFPSKMDMLASVKANKDAMAARYVESRRHTIQVDYISYMDELAGLIGAAPRIWETLKKDARLGRALLFGPVLPYEYRLEGPNTWPGARQAILSFQDRVLAPTATRKVPRSAGSLATLPFLLLGLLLLGLLLSLVF